VIVLTRTRRPDIDTNGWPFIAVVFPVSCLVFAGAMTVAALLVNATMATAQQAPAATAQQAETQSRFRAGIEEISIDGQTTDQQLATIRSRALPQIDDQTACWSQSLRPLLAAEGIHFLEQADRQARAIAQAMCLAPPESIGGKREQSRLT